MCMVLLIEGDKLQNRKMKAGSEEFISLQLF
jgi:hypothetical protein